MRVVLSAYLGRRFVGDRVREELGLCLGATRVDMAVINGSLHGYEIKSAKDTLARLDRQIHLYTKVLDYSSVVGAERHIAKLSAAVPASWGLISVLDAPKGYSLHCLRKPSRNLEVDPLSIAQLLWRDEAADILRKMGERVLTSETRWDLWDRLAEFPLSKLQSITRSQLKARPHWPGG